jgi:putative endonuclease
MIKDFLSASTLRQKTGRTAENTAKKYLRKQGLTFISSNFHCRHGEIDLIFKDHQTIVFVEVRFRKKSDYGSSIESIDFKKQQKIIKAAEFYLYKNKLTESVTCRFDVIGIEPKFKITKFQNQCYIKNSRSENYEIQWIKNVFN